VARYLQRALGTQTTPIRRVELRQEGDLKLDPGSKRWIPFTAVEVVKPMETAFEWKARVHVAPYVYLGVEDRYRKGVASGRASLYSLITLGQERGTPELNAGSLYRFLAEGPWYPSALVPSANLQWTAIDDDRAMATLTDHGITVSVEFRFDVAGHVTGIYAAARPRKGKSGYETAAWEGHFADYGTKDGMRVPLRGEVGWFTAGVWSCVWRGRIVSADYTF
jgi:hypothetical protein